MGISRSALLTLQGFWRPQKVTYFAEDVRRIGDHIQVICRCSAFEFPKICLNPNEVGYWEAKEYRQFLLCVGPVVLKDVLSGENYQTLQDFWFLCAFYAATKCVNITYIKSSTNMS